MLETRSGFIYLKFMGSIVIIGSAWGADDTGSVDPRLKCENST